MNREPRYWFAAKRYGWGWGLPLTWEGWVVYLGWIALFLGGLAVLGLRHQTLPHFLFVIVMIVVLFGLCYWKGEPPGRRSSD
jgi:hydrogenase/urease accessory protein HupE